ncbi:MAG TPA: DUF4118 domain-containing protein, partial [Ktedonobacteraceae bacterium]|nr:DUF4118 domain-containing protein [Ktedonobacteraceae bacterium]
MVDTVLGIIAPLLVTGIIYLFQLYPKIPDISIVYLLVVLGLASTRGRYSAVLASVIAFISFDFFLVPPLFEFTIAKFDEWLALFIFLVTAVITGQLAASLRRRVQQANQRESEARALYDLLSATTREESLESQLTIVARAIVKNFSFAGVRDCTILLPDDEGKLTIQADASLPARARSSDEVQAAAIVMHEGKIMDIYEAPALASSAHWFRRATHTKHAGACYVRLIPLQMGQRVVGVMRILLENTSERLVLDRELGAGKEPFNTHTAFFWTFLDQATSVIERARLRRESMRIELLQRTDALRAALLSSVSHDLRTPLSSIKAAASSLLQEDVQWSEEERRSFALAIEREADRL